MAQPWLMVHGVESKNMEALMAVIVLALIALPLVLSIVALVMASNAKGAAKRLERELQALKQRAPWPQPEFPISTPTPGPKPPELPPQPPEARPATAPMPKAAIKKIAAAKPENKPGAGNLEVALGGKVAAFIGIAVLVLGVVFFVGYAISHGWIGPGMRIVLGLLAGGVLIALGHVSEIKGKNLHVFARVLTGGGAALLFFSVFAAHGIYDLIPSIAALAGLLITVLAVMGLSVVYNSQIVALLGVSGAFITPLAIGGNFAQGIFPLGYFAAINATVMFLGVKRNWQSLYNVAFVFTVLFTGIWLTQEILEGDASEWLLGLVFSLVYFVEYTVLGLVKLKGERGNVGQVVDMVRMLLSSLLLLGAMYWILDAAKLNAWIGMAFLVTAAAHVVVVKLAWKWLPRFHNEVLVLLAGALTFATLALPAQLDGIWVSLGWSIEALVLAVFALRFGLGAFRGAGIFLGLLGLGKALLFDLGALNAGELTLFLNSRFAVSLIATILLGVQAHLYGKMADRADGGSRFFENAVLILACVGFVFAVAIDGLFILGENAPWAWMPAVIALLMAAGFALAVNGQRESGPLQVFAFVLLCLVPMMLLLFVFGMGWNRYDQHFSQFINELFIVGLILLAAVGGLAGRFTEGPGRGSMQVATLKILSLVAGILLVSLEINRAETDWKDTAITLWWAGCALVLIFLGLRKRIRYLRYTALALFGCTIAKVFLFDLAELNGLVRVAAFMGVGLILLVLSFTYQRLAPRLAPPPEPEPPEPEEQPKDSPASENAGAFR